jgi:hypothetical protein
VADRVAHFVEEAKAELVDALAHHNRRTPGAGDPLLEDVLVTADRICEDPSPWPVESDGYLDGNIDIVAVARRAGYLGRTK